MNAKLELTLEGVTEEVTCGVFMKRLFAAYFRKGYNPLRLVFPILDRVPFN